MSTSFVAVSFLYFFFSHPDALICLKENRNLECPIDYKPVCATFTCTDSPTGYCQETMDNACSACSESNIAGYIFGECSHNPVKSCSALEETECSNTDVEGTVCGITLGGETELDKVVYKNGCEACNKGAVDFYLGGEAHDQCFVIDTSSICQEQDRFVDNCPNDDLLKACVYYTGEENGCSEPICRKNAESWCFACGEPDALFYLNGRCEDNVPIPPEGIPVGDDDDNNNDEDDENSDNNSDNDDDSEDYDEPKSWKKDVKKNNAKKTTKASFKKPRKN